MKKEKLKSGLYLTHFEFFSRMVAWLEHHFTGAGHMANIQRILAKMFRILNTRGKTQAIKYVKSTRMALLKALEGYHSKQLCSNEQRMAIKFPKDLRFLKRVEGDKIYPVIRLVLSTLGVFRYLRGDGIPSFSSIESGSDKSDTPDSLREEVIPFLRSLGLNPRYFGTRSKKLNFKKFKSTVKAGPKGHALWTSYLDLLHLPDSLRESIGIVGGPRLREDMLNYLVLIPYVQDYYEKHLGKTRMTLRRLSIIRDKEGKNREIAILDYYSQQALRPLHNFLFSVLKRIPQDCTFDQGAQLLSLQPTPGSSFHSLDLSSATDRFPIGIQELILGELFGKEYSEHWKNVMVGFPFDYQGRSISYARGNPMGAYSSWTTFALAHHFIVYLACKKAGVQWKSCPYMLLGDDIVIANDKVAQFYTEYLQRFDIPYSKEKSHSSPYLFEFAKRFVHCGVEISPFPLAGIFENRNNWLLAVGTIFEETYRKRWEPRIDILHVTLGYLKVIGYNSRYISKRSAKIQMILMLRNAFAGRESMASAIQHGAFLLHGKDFLEQIKFLHSQFLVSEVLIKAFRKVFSESLQRIVDGKNQRPLGLIAEELTIRATSLFGVVEDPFMLIRSCPILQVYGEVEETYLRLLKDPMNDDALIKGDFRSFFREVTIMGSDESFYMRRKDVLQLATCRLADHILSTLKPMKGNLHMLHPMAY